MVIEGLLVPVLQELPHDAVASWLFVDHELVTDGRLLDQFQQTMVDMGIHKKLKDAPNKAALAVTDRLSGGSETTGTTSKKQRTLAQERMKNKAKALQLFLDGTGFTLNYQQMLEVQRRFPQHAHVVVQTAGTGVRVVEGYAHWVYNLQPCFKIAMEVLTADAAPRCVDMERHIRSNFSHGQENYMDVVGSVVERLVQWGKWAHQQ